MPLVLRASAADGETKDTDKIIYGTDDRKDLFEWTGNSNVLDWAASTVVLVNSMYLDCGASSCTIDAAYVDTLKDAQILCPGEKFEDQPTLGFCSGTLIDDDVVLTAGHCITSQAACDGMKIVFNYGYSSAISDEFTDFTFPAADVYDCDSFISDMDPFGRVDWATITLDRSASAEGHVPRSVSECTPPKDERLTIIGHPSGLPAKIIQFPLAEYSTDLDPGGADNWGFYGPGDTFGGNSGSGVFLSNGELVGILVRGNPDYEAGPDGTCNIPHVVANNYGLNSGQEQMTWASIAVNRHDTGGATTACPEICGASTSCALENCDRCPDDDGPSRCFLCSAGYSENWAYTDCSANECYRTDLSDGGPTQPGYANWWSLVACYTKAPYTDPNDCSNFKYCSDHPTFANNAEAGYGGYTRPVGQACPVTDSYGSEWRSDGASIALSSVAALAAAAAAMTRW